MGETQGEPAVGWSGGLGNEVAFCAHLVTPPELDSKPGLDTLPNFSETSPTSVRTDNRGSQCLN